MWVIHYNHVATLTCDGPADGCGCHDAVLGVLVFRLYVLVAKQSKAITPVPPEPIRLQNKPAVHRVFGGQALRVGGEQPFQLRPLGPTPRRPHNAHQDAFHVPGRHVDQ
ncbi:hypothetical protein D3C81_1767600 [compost metagenome]